MVSNPFSSHTSGGPGSEPSEPPPAYAQATGQQPAAGAHAGHQHTSSLEIPGNARRASSDYTASEEEHEEVIPANERAAADALTDERPIPKGWSREFDVNSGHVFFVDTQANPPRSIWTHPLDDPEYVSTLPLDQQPQWAAAKTKKDDPYTPTGAAGPHGEHNPHPVQGTSTQRQSHPSQPQHQQGEDKRTFGRKLKDKLTNSSHEDRVRERAAQAKAERERYEQYIKRRKALQDAVNSGQYQPRFSAPSGAYTYGGGYGGMGYGGGYGGLGGGMGSRYGGGYDIYGSSYDRYGYPNRRYAPGGMYGMGGSRAGMGTGMALGGGLLGGLLIGDLMF